jgi:thiamine-monophosphate kinase
VDLWAASIPVAQGATLDLALGGGEDYELCFAAVPGQIEARRAEFEARFGTPLTRVGTVAAGQGVLLDRADGSAPAPLSGGFDHFGRA